MTFVTLESTREIAWDILITRRRLWPGIVFLGLLLPLVLFSCAPSLQESETITVFAAASLQDVLSDFGQDYLKKTGLKVRFSFGSSGVLARQIAQGAPADLFLSAHRQWIDYLQNQTGVDLLVHGPVAVNRLVVVTSASAPVPMTTLQDLLSINRLVLANTHTSPAGIYAKQVLVKSGLWDELSGRLLEGSHVRAALTLIQRGEGEAGIVYQTDVDPGQTAVHIAFTIKPDLHDPIEYIGVSVLDKQQDHGAGKFIDFITSQESRMVWQHHGF